MVFALLNIFLSTFAAALFLKLFEVYDWSWGVVATPLIFYIMIFILVLVCDFVAKREPNYPH